MKLHEEICVGFLCYLCAFEATSDNTLEKHKEDEHSEDQVDGATVERTSSDDNQTNSDNDDSGEENLQLKRKLRMIEESYDRLMGMYQKQQKEFKDKALVYKCELEEVNECLRLKTKS